MDIDNDGTVSRHELKIFLRNSLKLNVSDEQITQLLAQFDSNGDGVISFSEFKNYLNS